MGNLLLPCSAHLYSRLSHSPVAVGVTLGCEHMSTSPGLGTRPCAYWLLCHFPGSFYPPCPLKQWLGSYRLMWIICAYVDFISERSESILVNFLLPWKDTITKETLQKNKILWGFWFPRVSHVGEHSSRQAWCWSSSWELTFWSTAPGRAT